MMIWFNKSRRAQSNTDYETWVEGGVVPTMNAFDNGDTRATTIIFYGNRVGDMRLQNDKINTLQARMGTGGNNMPMVAEIKAYDEYNDSISDTHHTLRSGTKQSTGVLGSQVRRLTPLECERLQGFPDGWTADQVDTHRYKQMGNAVAVPVVEWIIQGITDSI
jgi:site-specific DNA-cytosine methylase